MIVIKDIKKQILNFTKYMIIILLIMLTTVNTGRGRFSNGMFSKDTFLPFPLEI